MKKSIILIHNNTETATQIMVNLSSPNTEVINISSMSVILHSIDGLECCLVIIDAAISAKDGHQILAAIRKLTASPILVISSQSSHTVKPVLGQKAAHNGKVVYSLDFEVTPHQLRHTYITNLIYKGVDPKTVQYLAVHENSKMTMDIYAKVKYNKPEKLLSVVNCAFFKGFPQGSPLFFCEKYDTRAFYILEISSNWLYNFY